MVTQTTRVLAVYRVRWHDHEGNLKSCRTMKKTQIVDVALRVRSQHGLDYPIEFQRWEQGDEEWTSLSLDDLIRSMASRKWMPFHARPGFVNPSWWVDR